MNDMSFTVPSGFDKVEGPILFKFERQGDTLRGLFVRAKSVQINGDEVIEMYILEPSGTTKKFRASFDLREKMTRGMIGKEVIIRYMRDDPSKGKDGNPMKEFGVWASKNVTLKGENDTEAEHPYTAEDADIPF